MEQNTKTYSREDIRNLWRRYKYEGDRQSGNEFAAIANAQSQNYKTFQAEIDRECREEDMEFRYESRANTRAAPEQRHRAGIESIYVKSKIQRFRRTMFDRLRDLRTHTRSGARGVVAPARDVGLGRGRRRKWRRHSGRDHHPAAAF